MRNFLLGALLCYIVFLPKVQASIPNDIENIVSSLQRIANSVLHIEHILAKPCKK